MAIELARGAIKHIDIIKSNVFRGIWATIRNFNLKFVLFATGYPTTYRVINHNFNFISLSAKR